MLSHLHITHFAIIEEEVIDLSSGFTALTGETGAGKSILLDAIMLLLGGRASADMVRHGENRATIKARFDLGVEERELVRARLKSLELLDTHHEYDPNTLSVRRVISVSGRNLVYINGLRSSISALRELTAGLIEVVRQHESYTLLDPEQHLSMLDSFGELNDKASALRVDVSRWRELEQESKKLRKTQAERDARIEALQAQLDHLERLGPEPQEDERIERELRLMHASESLQEWVESGVKELYDSSPSIIDQVGLLSRGLEPIVHIDERLAQFHEALERVHLELDELVYDLRIFRKEIPHDHSAMLELESRRAQLEQLKDQYGLSLAEIVEQVGALRRERDELETLNRRVRAAEVEAHGVLKAAQIKAKALSRARLKLGPQLATQIEDELKHLGMAQCRFKVQFNVGKLNYQGLDRVEFLISPNPGEGFKPLARIASGGELSRLMLALKVVLMDSDQTPTYLFDEVDTGIGGAIAEGVGIKLKRIAATRQVICITHLPQVACSAHRHLKIMKELHADRTFSSISELSALERVHEVARMLGGQDLTETTLAHAREMVERGRGDSGVAREVELTS